ncbi:MAG: ABC transporter permease subunit [Bacteroidetes bacterium]|nr:ABC transporter permease subunit [Bacteroidota bacterium]
MEFRRNARSLFLWSFIICALIFFTMSFFHSVLQYQQQIMGMVKLVPMAAMKARGFGNINDIFSGLGFYAANNIVYMMLLGSIYSMVLTSNILLKEEYSKTAEFLMSRPISRNEIFASKMALAFLNVFILNLVAGLVSFISLEVFKSGDFRVQPFLVLTLYTFLLNLFFGALGFVIAALMKRARPVTFFCVGLVLVFYFLFTISRLSGVNGDFGYISPFKWVNVEVLKPGYGPELWRIAVFLGLSACLVLASGFIYRKKDILT